MNVKTIFFIFTITTVNMVNCANILAIFSFPGKSHFMMTKTLIKELVLRGHNVTFISPFSLGETFNNLDEIILPIHDFWSDIKNQFGTHNLFDLTDMPFYQFMKMVNLIGLKTTESALKEPKIQQLINDTTSNYDLLFVEQFYQEAFLAFAYKYNIPVVTMSTLGFENYNSQQFGIITPWSYVPHGFVPFDDKMNFYQRILNTIYNAYEDFDREFLYFPEQDKLVEKYFSHLPVKIPSVSNMEKSTSSILLNSYPPLVTPRPFIYGMVQVGGVHIKKAKPLPENIKKFLDDAKEGVIYFSLGSNLRSSDMPAEKAKIFLSVFKKLKQRVLWKWEDENISELPKNVMIQSWMPQSDILAHPNIKVFITHGGLFGTQEGVHYGIPLLGIPIYCDQNLNINKAEKSGYAIRLYFPNITEVSLSWALNELLYNPSYQNTAQITSKIFRDRPMSAIDTAMYWIDYVIRYKGAPQLRSAGLDLPWYSFYLLDVIAVLVLLPLLIVYILYKIIAETLKTNISKNKKKHSKKE